MTAVGAGKRENRQVGGGDLGGGVKTRNEATNGRGLKGGLDMMLMRKTCQ